MKELKKSKQNTTHTLRLPQSLRRSVSENVKYEQRANMHQFISLAVVEKLSTMNTKEFFKERADQIDTGDFWGL